MRFTQWDFRLSQRRILKWLFSVVASCSSVEITRCLDATAQIFVTCMFSVFILKRHNHYLHACLENFIHQNILHAWCNVWCGIIKLSHYNEANRHQIDLQPNTPEVHNEKTQPLVSRSITRLRDCAFQWNSFVLQRLSLLVLDQLSFTVNLGLTCSG